MSVASPTQVFQPTSDTARWIALGREQMDRGDHARALAMFQAALVLDPDCVEALYHSGECYVALDCLAEARRMYEAALERALDRAAIWRALGDVLINQGDPDGSARAFDEALRLEPDNSVIYSRRLRAEQYRPSVTPERFLELSRGWGERYSPKLVPLLAPRLRRSGEPIRVGFVSAYFRRNPVGYFLSGLLRNLDPHEITAMVYDGTERPDDLTAALREHVGSWRDVRDVPDDELLRLIRADGVDVLIDLSGHLRGNRLGVFERRAAPTQITWAGYAGTTGLRAMDYTIGDHFEIPEGHECFYSERVLRMPHDYVCWEPPPGTPDVGPLPAERNGHITFGGFHNAAKCGELSVPLWASVLHAVPGSRLILAYWLLDDPEATARLRQRFAAAGIPPERVRIAGAARKPGASLADQHWHHLDRYRERDVALDALPYAGGVTTIEALWMGVPVVTLPGRTFAGRHSLTHLSNAALPELVAADEDGYVRIAAELAGDRRRLAELRRGLRPRLLASPIMDHRAFAGDFTELVRVAHRPREGTPTLAGRRNVRRAQPGRTAGAHARPSVRTHRAAACILGIQCPPSRSPNT